MNRIFRHRGYRFVQQGYADEGRISILSVVHDPWGISVCYSAYALLLISLFGFFFQKRSRFRALVAKLGRSSAVAALLLLPLSLSARNEELPVLDKELAGRLGELNVYYNDRVAPLETLARDYCLKLYGSRKPTALPLRGVVCRSSETQGLRKGRCRAEREGKPAYGPCHGRGSAHFSGEVGRVSELVFLRGCLAGGT